MLPCTVHFEGQLPNRTLLVQRSRLSVCKTRSLLNNEAAANGLILLPLKYVVLKFPEAKSAELAKRSGCMSSPIRAEDGVVVRQIESH